MNNFDLDLLKLKYLMMDNRNNCRGQNAGFLPKVSEVCPKLIDIDGKNFGRLKNCRDSTELVIIIQFDFCLFTITCWLNFMSPIFVDKKSCSAIRRFPLAFVFRWSCFFYWSLTVFDSCLQPIYHFTKSIQSLDLNIFACLEKIFELLRKLAEIET